MVQCSRGEIMGNSQTKATNKYHKDKYDRLYPFVPKGRKAEIQAVADAQGESLNDFIIKAIDERMERIQADYDKLSNTKKWYRSEEGKEAIKKLMQK